MRVSTLPLILLACLLLAGCCTGVSSDSLVFVGAAPAAVSGTGADGAGVLDALRTLMEQRTYDPGMSMTWSCAKENNSKLRNGPVITSPGVSGGFVTGSGAGSGDYYTMEFAVPEGQLTVRFVYDHGQHLIYEVRPRSEPAESVTRIPADCHLVGMLGGQSVDLTFQQQLFARRINDQYDEVLW